MSASRTEKLAQQGVVAIMDAYQSGVTFPTTQDLARPGICNLSPAQRACTPEAGTLSGGERQMVAIARALMACRAC
jgi:ABC-type phosphate/phosphonate transport system ATPase subunit